MRSLLDAARSEQTEGVGPGRDVRLVIPAAAAWVGAIAGTMLALRWVVAVAVLALFVVGAIACWAPPVRLAAIAAAVCLLAVAGAGAARVSVLGRGPVHDLAAREAYVSVTATVTDDPLLRTSPSRFGPERSYVIARLRVTEVSGRGHRYHVRSPVLLVAGEDWLTTTPGQRVRAAGRLAPGEAAEGLGAVLRTSVPPTVIGEPPGWLRWTEPLRDGLRQSVSALPEGPRGLVPALVVGDESRLPPDLTEDMRTAGLLHLNAVSGANTDEMEPLPDADENPWSDLWFYSNPAFIQTHC